MIHSQTRVKMPNLSTYFSSVAFVKHTVPDSHIFMVLKNTLNVSS